MRRVRTRRASGDGALCKNDRDSTTGGAVLPGCCRVTGKAGPRCQQIEQLRVLGVLRKQAENTVEDTTDRTAERVWQYAGDEDSGGSENVADQAGEQL